MKEYWGAITEFYDDGKVKAYICSTLATQRPENKCEKLLSCDRYVKWFRKEKEARTFVAQAKKA